MLASYLSCLVPLFLPVFGEPKLGKKPPAPDPEYILKRNAIQRTTPRPADPNSCPCVRMANGQCFPYNSAYQAVTLEEAVVNFVDPSTLDVMETSNIFGHKLFQQTPPSSTSARPSTFKCAKHLECIGCHQAISERLISQMEPADYRGLGLGLSNLNLENPPPLNVTLYCKRVALRTPETTQKPFILTDDQVQAMVKVARLAPRQSNTSRSGRRQKRDGSKGSVRDKGISTPLDCSYKRGDPLDDNSGYVGLCSLCWSLRTMSPKYFPRYINELSCSEDKTCLGTGGKCRERYRSVDILYNSGSDTSPRWVQYSLNSPIACECQVLSGSTLQSLVEH